MCSPRNSEPLAQICGCTVMDVSHRMKDEVASKDEEDATFSTEKRVRVGPEESTYLPCS